MQSMNTVNTYAGLSISALAQILGAVALGVLMLYGVGFAEVEAAHNAAHDARHAFAFPCH